MFVWRPSRDWTTAVVASPPAVSSRYLAYCYDYAYENFADLGFGNHMLMLMNMLHLRKALHRTLLLARFGFVHGRFDHIFDFSGVPQLDWLQTEPAYLDATGRVSWWPAHSRCMAASRFYCRAPEGWPADSVDRCESDRAPSLLGCQRCSLHSAGPPIPVRNGHVMDTLAADNSALVTLSGEFAFFLNSTALTRLASGAECYDWAASLCGEDYGYLSEKCFPLLEEFISVLPPFSQRVKQTADRIVKKMRSIIDQQAPVVTCGFHLRNYKGNPMPHAATLVVKFVEENKCSALFVASDWRRSDLGVLRGKLGSSIPVIIEAQDSQLDEARLAVPRTREDHSLAIAVLVEILSQMDYFAGDGRSTLSQFASRIRINVAKTHPDARNDATRVKERWIATTFQTKHLIHRYLHPGVFKTKCRSGWDAY